MGGFALAARWAGIQTVQFVEFDNFCQKVLQKNFQGVPIHDDVKTFHYGDKSTWQEYAQNVNKQKLHQTDRIASHAIQSELWGGETNIEKSTDALSENGQTESGSKLSPTMEGNAPVAERKQKNFSPLTTSTTMETKKEEIISPKHGKSQSKEGCQAIIKSSAITATMRKQTMENVHIKGAKNEQIFLLTAGPPCQPASCAGKRGGTTDDRWLWGETFRVIAEVKPRWCILENVRGLLTLEQGLVFDNLLSELEAIGYETTTFVIPACAVNAPHRRDRVWIIGHTKHDRRNRQEIPIQSRGSQQENIVPTGTSGHASYTKSKQAQSSEQGGFHSKSCGKDCLSSNSKKSGLERRNTERPGSSGGWDTEHTFSSKWEDKTKPWNEPWIKAAQRLCCTSYGVPDRLVRYSLTQPETNGIMGFILMLRRYHYGTSEEKRTEKILPVLRGAFAEKTVQRCFGRLSEVFEKEDLRCFVHGEMDGERKKNKVGISESGITIQEDMLRGMWNKQRVEHTSSGWGLDKQCSCQFDDVVCELSHEIALGEWKSNAEVAQNILFSMWQKSGGERFLHEPLQALYEIWQSITDKEIGSFRRHLNLRDKDKTNRLKALGNSIVPQIAYVIFEAIKRLEFDKKKPE